MVNSKSLAFLLLGLAGGSFSQTIFQYDCVGFPTNSGTQANLAYYGINDGAGPTFCGFVLGSYNQACKNSFARCQAFSSDKGDAFILSAFAQNHDFDDVNGCAGFAVQQASTFLKFTVSNDPSFDGCLQFNPEQPAKRSLPGEGEDSLERELLRRDETSNYTMDSTHELTRRQLPFNPDAVPNIFDTVTLASGTTLTLTSLVTDAAPNNLDHNVAVALRQQVADALGNLGVTSGGTIQAIPGGIFSGPKFFEVSFDAGINQGAGPIFANDWTTIVGALANSLTQGQNKRKLTAGFTIAGAVVLTVTVGSLLT